MVDITLQRHVLHLGSTQHQEYPAGTSSMQFAVPKIDLDGLKKSWLNNVGLLLVKPVTVPSHRTSVCTFVVKRIPLTSLQVILKDKSGEQILQVSMVTQVFYNLSIS